MHHRDWIPARHIIRRTEVTVAPAPMPGRQYSRQKAFEIETRDYRRLKRVTKSVLLHYKMSSTTLQDMNDIPGFQSSNEEKDLKIVEFEGEGDKWDPKNFRVLKKWAILLAVTHGAVIVTCASSLYVCPLVIELTADFLLLPD